MQESKNILTENFYGKQLFQERKKNHHKLFVHQKPFHEKKNSLNIFWLWRLQSKTFLPKTCFHRRTFPPIFFGFFIIFFFFLSLNQKFYRKLISTNYYFTKKIIWPKTIFPKLVFCHKISFLSETHFFIKHNIKTKMFFLSKYFFPRNAFFTDKRYIISSQIFFFNFFLFFWSQNKKFQKQFPQKNHLNSFVKPIFFFKFF